MRFLGRALVGLACSLVYLSLLTRLNVLDVGPWASGRGGGWILPILLAGPIIAVLLGTPQPGRGLAVVLIVMMAVPGLDGLALTVREKRAHQRYIRQVEQWLEAARQAAREQFGSRAEVVEALDPATGCTGLMVRVAGAGVQTWYWYDTGAGRIAGSLSEARLRSLVLPLLPAGARITGVVPMEHQPHLLVISFDGAAGPKRAVAQVASGCAFWLEVVALEDPYREMFLGIPLGMD